MEQQERKRHELMKAILSIELILEDNNQNFKDCTKILKELKRDLFPQKENIFKRVIRKLKP